MTTPWARATQKLLRKSKTKPRKKEHTPEETHDFRRKRIIGVLLCPNHRILIVKLGLIGLDPCISFHEFVKPSSNVAMLLPQISASKIEDHLAVRDMKDINK